MKNKGSTAVTPPEVASAPAPSASHAEPIRRRLRRP